MAREVSFFAKSGQIPPPAQLSVQFFKPKKGAIGTQGVSTSESAYQQGWHQSEGEPENSDAASIIDCKQFYSPTSSQTCLARDSHVSIHEPRDVPAQRLCEESRGGKNLPPSWQVQRSMLLYGATLTCCPCLWVPVDTPVNRQRKL